eukprot:TRINITY_DN78464_c0_g1_i1.p1 TRINITY_DN78464_c0_g1~~TRINITY_DN78464_c0_g1_i1.p1  ORF type:complete len:142 (+),score=25.75 TRINITY_DN78464_c0_g1_i1:65-427(+)
MARTSRCRPLSAALLFGLIALVSRSMLQDLAFAGTGAAAPATRSAELQMAAVPGIQQEDFATIGFAPDASSVLLAGGDMETIPFVTFLVSMFLGVVGYSAWTAFGPASADLRDPFEEHED